MTWPLHGPVDERDDYRDPAFVAKIARAAAQGVVIAGVSRSGKTTLLHRLHESDPAHFGRIISLELQPRGTLAKLRETRGQAALLDEGQLLRKWPAKAQKELIAALKYRPFVLAAWPSLFDPEESEELQPWLEQLRLERLLPLSRREARALIERERSDAPIACDDATVAALFEATGGYAVLLARLCDSLSDNGTSSLRRPDEAQLERFVDSVQQWNDPFQAILTSLPSAHQRAVRELAGGQQGNLAWLIDHGLARDNPPRFSGTLFSFAWSAPAPPPPPPPPPPLPSRRIFDVLRWVHLSDLHFGAGDASRGFDRQAVTRAICEDARRITDRIGRPDRIFITGDIAQKADPEEYAAAHAWLRVFGDTIGSPLDQVRVVPGNHDVDRGVADQRRAQRAHAAIRESPEELDEDLSDPGLRQNLAEKLLAYRRFVAERLTGHPAACPTELDWTESLPEIPGQRGKVRIAGLATVWVSDRSDGRDPRAPQGRALCPNLIVGRAQLKHTLGEPSEGALLLVLCHHPPEWLDPKSRAWLQSALAPHPHVHLSGHVHDARAGALKTLGRAGTSVRFVAGAAHGEPLETYGYAWGGVRWNGQEGRWEVGWAPRVYMAELQCMVPDRNRYPELGADDFVWAPIAVGWAPPE